MIMSMDCEVWNVLLVPRRARIQMALRGAEWFGAILGIDGIPRFGGRW
jgi:hypothetical protein